MADYGFCFHPVLHREDCSGFLHLWIKDNRNRLGMIPTRYGVHYNEWDPVAGRLRVSKTSTTLRKIQLRYYAAAMKEDLASLAAIIDDLSARGICFFDNIVRQWEMHSGRAAIEPSYEPEQA